MFRDRGNNYRSADYDPPIQVPNTLNARTIDDSYAIPEISNKYTLQGEFVLPRPDPLLGAIERDAVRINKLGDSQWILVDGTPGEVWPRLRGFLSLNSIQLARADAVNGILETVWLQPKKETIPKERFRIILDQGVQRRTTEVYIRQANQLNAPSDWPAASSDREREDIMIRELSQYLADSATSASVSMLAQQGMDSSGKVKLEEGTDKTPLLALDLPFSRAWASLGLALEKAGMTIDDLNREQRVYFVKYIILEDDEFVKEEPGFFARLFSSKEELEGVPYFIRVKPATAERVIISVEKQSGDALSEDEAIKILKVIKRYLA